MERIGIFGGSFDPVHNAHIRLGLFAMQSLSLSRVIYVPTAFPPHKVRALTENKHRVEMLRLAVGAQTGFLISEYELANESYSYTADTLKYFSKLYPKAQLVLLVGADSAAYLDNWYKADYIFKTAEIAVLARGGHDADLQAIIERLQKKNGARISQIPGEGVEISSAKIRDMVMQREDISSFVPKSVADYIAKNGLYATPPTVSCEDFDLERAAKHLSYLLKPARYTHSIGVMETAAQMAKRFGCDIKKAQIAGLLHDCAKNMDEEKSLKQCHKFNLTVDAVMENAPGLLHQLLGPSIAAKEFCIDDKEILDAIGCHTTGRADMTTLDKILYLADFIEPNRNAFDGLEKLRKLCKKDLDAAMLYALELSIKHVLSKGELLHPDTVLARNAFLQRKTQKTIEK